MTIKTCPVCSEEIAANAKKCKHCGVWINGRGKLHLSLNVISLVSAIVALVVSTYPLAKRMLEAEASQVEIIEAYWDGGSSVIHLYAANRGNRGDAISFVSLSDSRDVDLNKIAAELGIKVSRDRTIRTYMESIKPIFIKPNELITFSTKISNDYERIDLLGENVIRRFMKDAIHDDGFEWVLTGYHILDIGTVSAHEYKYGMYSIRLRTKN